MNKKQLLEFREDIDATMRERRQLGDYDANSRYVNFLLKCLSDLTDHAIEQYPKSKSLPPRKSAKQNDAKA